MATITDIAPIPPALDSEDFQAAQLSPTLSFPEAQDVLLTATPQPVAPFHRWRPQFHLMPARNWANDPCGPGYSPSGRCYHLSFQWNPLHWEWGNMSWGHATSRDLVHWTVSPEPSIKPSALQDSCGVFTGCTWPTNPAGVDDGTITSLYTSAQRSPIHWSLPYVEGSELIRMATSTDNGHTWQRDESASIVPGPPEGLDVTSWRDPFVAPWDAVDTCLGRTKGEHLYGVVAGGIRHASPAVFLYSVNPRDLSQWSFMSTLFAPGLHFTPSSRIPEFGSNFEVTNFATLKDDDGTPYDVLFMGIEGSLQLEKPPSMWSRSKRDKSKLPKRADHAQNWLCGTLRPTAETSPQGTERQSVTMEYCFGGSLDFGCYYAANSFHDPVTNSQIVYGWITEDDLPQELIARQQWAGLLSLPRVLGMRRIKNVVATSHSDLQSLDWLYCTKDSDETYSVTSLTSTPDPRLSALRTKEIRLSSIGDGNVVGFLPLDTGTFELEASFSVSKSVEKVGLVLYHSAGN